MPTGARTPLSAAHELQGTLPLDDPYSVVGDLRGCRCAVRCDEQGRFQIHTVDPGVYGPPQHFELRVTAPRESAESLEGL